MNTFNYGEDYYPKSSILDYGEGYYPDPHAKVKDPNSEVTKQTTIEESSDGTKTTTTVENKTNNPKWRGENQDKDVSLENYKPTQYQDNRPVGDGSGDIQSTSSVATEEASPSIFDEVVYGYPETVQPLEGVEELTSPQTDEFWRVKDNERNSIENQLALDNADTDDFGNPLVDSTGVSIFDAEYFEALRDSALQNSLPSDMQEKPWKTKKMTEEEQKRYDFMSRYITNPQTEEEKAINEKLVWANKSLAEKAGTVATDTLIDGLGWVVPVELIDDVADLITDEEIQEEVVEYVKENPATSLAAATLLVLSRGKIKKVPKAVSDKLNKVLNKNPKIKKGVDKLFKEPKFQRDKYGKLILNKKGQPIPAYKSVKGVKGVQRVTGLSPKKIGAWGLGGLAAGEQLGYFDSDLSADEVSQSKEDSAPKSDWNKVTESASSKALERLAQDREGQAIADAAQRDSNIAQMIINNQGRIQREYGMDLAKDLFTVAVGALAGFSPMSIMGAKGDKILLDQEHARNLELQGLKDQQAMAREQIKLNAKAQKEALKEHKVDRKGTEDRMMAIVKEGGKKGSSLSTLSNEVLRSLQMADALDLDYADHGVQEALVKATQDAVNDKSSWFDSEEDEAFRSNIAGKFMGNMAILSGNGSLSKDGFALKNATEADSGKYTHWLFTRHDAKDVPKVSAKKFSEWKTIREDKGESWMWYNNFPGWAVQNLKATGQL